MKRMNRVSMSQSAVALIPAATTAILRSLIQNGVTAPPFGDLGLGQAKISAWPLSRISQADKQEQRINLFLYQAQTKGGFPVRTGGESPGFQIQAFEMSYMLSVHGEENFQSELLFGVATSALAQKSRLNSAEIAASVANLKPADDQPELGRLFAEIGSTNVVSRFEALEICPMLEGADKMLDLWSKLQAPLRLSQTYQVVVRIASAG